MAQLVIVAMALLVLGPMALAGWFDPTPGSPREYSRHRAYRERW